MEISTDNYPDFVTGGIKLQGKRGADCFGSLTVNETEILVKSWLYETLRTMQSPEELKPIVYTKQETARMLRISVQSLNNHVKHGTIKPRKLGGRVFFLPEDIKEALKTE